MSNGRTRSSLRGSVGEEIANAVTHGIGLLLSIGGFVVLGMYGTADSLLAFAVYGVTLMLLYLASTLYHSLIFTRARSLFRKFDHMAIFLLIAGTYTPFCLLAMEGWLSLILLGTVWLFAVLGIVMKSLFTGRFEWLSVSIYIATGWLVVFAIKPIYEALSPAGFFLLVGGGLAYSIGTFFYVRSSIPYNHSIWHLWVLAGSVLHFFSVLTLI